MVAKKNTKTKSKKQKSVKSKKAKTAKSSINDLINEADSALVITAKNGMVQVLGIKNANYAYQAKGLMQGALDTYLVRPISNVLKDVNDANGRMHHGTLQTIRQLLDKENEKKK